MSKNMSERPTDFPRGGLGGGFSKKPKVGDLVKADILEREEVDGQAGGLDSRYKLVGVGEVDASKLYAKDEILHSHKVYAAKIMEVPED